MKPKTQERHYESAHEEFARRVKELYQLAEKMGLRITVSVKAKSPTPPPQRQPGEN